MSTAGTQTAERADHTRLIAALFGGLTVLAAALAVAGFTGPVRAVVTLAFVLVVPGWSLLAFFRPPSSATTWALAVAVSVSIELITAQFMLMTGGWRPEAASVALFAGAGLLLLVQIVRLSRRPRDEATG